MTSKTAGTSSSENQLDRISFDPTAVDLISLHSFATSIWYLSLNFYLPTMYCWFLHST